VIESFQEGVTLSSVPPSRTPAGLLDAEARLVALLRRAARSRKAA
jgi:hypothetical protein